MEIDGQALGSAILDLRRDAAGTLSAWRVDDEGANELMTLSTRRCECGAADCDALIQISHEEQDAVDHDPRNLWIVAPGHPLRGARSAVVVADFQRYTVVEAEEDA